MTKLTPAGWFTVAECAQFTGMTAQGIRASYLPAMPDDAVDRSRKPMLLHGASVVALLVERRISEQPNEASLLTGSDSEGLERYRLAKAETAELDLAERRGELIDRERCRDVLGRWASILRRAGWQLQCHHGPEPFAVLNDALDDCEALVRDELGTGDE